MRKGLPVVVAVLVGLTLAIMPGSGPERSVPRNERVVPTRVVASSGGAVKLAVPEFAVMAGEPELEAAAGAAGEVFRQDVAFEGVFDLVPAGETPPLPVSPSPGGTSFSLWRRLGADALITGRVGRTGDGTLAEVRLFDVSSGELAWGRGYSAPTADPRRLGHVIADEFLRAQADLSSVALTQLAFVSDRGGTRRELGGTLRRFKEVWVADYDGASQRPLTADRNLNMTPSWSPDGGLVAYTSFRRGYQDIFVSPLDRVLPPNGAQTESPTRGRGKNWLPAWSPDGSRLAFTSNRDGNPEIYVVNRDGADLERLTRHWAIDTSPAWSPSGTEIAFTSDRTGSPQIWIMNANGGSARALTAEKYCDRATWAPPPRNEIAYVSRTKTGFDIKVKDVETGEERQLTHGEGFNESPAWSPNGRHIAFSSTRRGGQQIWTMTRTGGDLRQVTTAGNNTMPAWSRPPAASK